MITLYYLTVLITLIGPIPTGWIQYTDAYTSRSFCQKKITLMAPQMRIEIQARFPKKLVSIGEFECTTREDVIERNTKLGH